jgi:hypothetical protein
VSFKIYESQIYKEFRDLKNEDPIFYKDDFYDVKEILTFLAANLRRAANRGDASQKIEVNLDYVYNVGASQDFLCALTGDELEFTRGGQTWLGKWCNPNSCTIDRIDSDKGYVEGNIQLITWKANCLKQHLDNNEFIEFCKDVARWNK